MVSHFAWVLFNLTGFFWSRRWPVLGKIHVGTLGLTMSFFIFLGKCPVSDLEWRLRTQSSAAGAPEGSFIAHYVRQWLYVDVPSNVIGCATLALFFLSVYLHIFRPWWKARQTSIGANDPPQHS